MNPKRKIIFLNSYCPRTGHNFTSEVIKVFTNHIVLPHPQSETKIGYLLGGYERIFKTKINSHNYKPFFDALFMQGLRERILEQAPHEFIMIKDTSFIGVEHLAKIFPEDIHILLLRDPNRVFNSRIKSMNLDEKNWKNQLKRIGVFTGIYPYFYSRKLSKQFLKELPDFTNHIIIKYEDLVAKEEQLLKQLKQTFETEKSLSQIKKEIDEIPVINSSFFGEVGAKKIWDARPKTSQFSPLTRKGNSLVIRKAIALGSKKFRKKLNYI